MYITSLQCIWPRKKKHKFIKNPEIKFGKRIINDLDVVNHCLLLKTFNRREGRVPWHSTDLQNQLELT